jgi:membrane protein insertase Oxa1/YidC/SpoIIIJ
MGARARDDWEQRYLDWLYRFIPNYGLAVIVLTIMVRMVTALMASVYMAKESGDPRLIRRIFEELSGGPGSYM